LQLVGGSSALALAMTVVSNLLGIMIVSFLLPHISALRHLAMTQLSMLHMHFLYLQLIPLLGGKFKRSISFYVTTLIILVNPGNGQTKNDATIKTESGLKLY
jgi:predicted Na+-dependent transporter